MVMSVQAQSAPVNQVFVVMEENTPFPTVIGNPTLPYMNSLARQYSLARNCDKDSGRVWHSLLVGAANLAMPGKPVRFG